MSLRAAPASARALLRVALLGAALIPAGAIASPSAPLGTLVQCPDWKAYAPPVVLARKTDGQTRDSFTVRTAPAGDASRPATPPLSALRTRESCTHTVAKGDTLGKIAAQRLGKASRWPDIRTANPGLDPNRLVIGTVLTLPCAGIPHSPPATGTASFPAGSVPARPGLLARLFGTGKPPGQTSAGAAPLAGAEPLAGAAPARKTAESGGGGARGAVRVSSQPAPRPSVLPPPGATAVVLPPPAPPVPVWTAKRGDYLRDVLMRWGKTAGWTVIVDSTDAWRLAVPVRIQAPFDEAVGEIVRGLGHSGLPPRVRLYPNKVLRLGGPL